MQQLAADGSTNTPAECERSEEKPFSLVVLNVNTPYSAAKAWETVNGQFERDTAANK